nr:hypothetical protein [Tanacetum cinerariifolium]
MQTQTSNTLQNAIIEAGSKDRPPMLALDRTVTTSNELDLLFSPMFDELLNGSSKAVSKSSAVCSADAPNQRQHHTTPLNNHTTPAHTCQVLTLAPTVTSSENINQVETYAENDQVADDEFINIFYTRVQDQGETSSHHILISGTISEMEHSNPTLAKILILDTRKFKQWKFRIQQYIHNEHYALWEVIEFGDSYEAPKNDAATGSASEGSAKNKGRTVAVMTEDMKKRRNDVKARTTLLLALPDEHQLRFNKYKTTQELWAAILKTFDGNEATRKTNKNLDIC